MEDLKKWIKAHWSTAVMTVLLVVVLISPDAKAWLMRQIASTGILNSSISEPVKNPGNKTAYTQLMLKNENGSLIDPAHLKDKVVFINFWASWCPPCRAEFPSVEQLYNKYKSHSDMVFLTVNLDDNPDLGKAYLKEKGFTVPFITPAGTIPGEFYNGSLPTTVVLDKKGEIRLHHTGVADYSKDSFYREIDGLLK